MQISEDVQELLVMLLFCLLLQATWERKAIVFFFISLNSFLDSHSFFFLQPSFFLFHFFPNFCWSFFFLGRFSQLNILLRLFILFPPSERYCICLLARILLCV